MEKITKHINRMQRMVQHHRTMHFRKYNLLGHHISYLLAIYNNPGLSQEEITNWLNINKSTVTRNVSTLIDLGYIKRETDPNDKRGYKLYSTEKLNKFIPDIFEYLTDYNRELLSDLSEDEKKIFLEALTKVSKKACELNEVKDV